MVKRQATASERGSPPLDGGELPGPAWRPGLPPEYRCDHGMFAQRNPASKGQVQRFRVTRQTAFPECPLDASGEGQCDMAIALPAWEPDPDIGK